MPSCAFNRCTNSSRSKNKAHGITFHKFPNHGLQRKKWLLIVRKQRKDPDWIPTNHSRICSVHFETEDMYMTNKGYRKLYKCAVPHFLEVMKAANYSRSRSKSINSLYSDSTTDLESICETEEKTFLNKKSSDSTMRNRRLTGLDNTNLQKKKKILNRTCKSLKEAVAQLRMKLDVTEEQFTELCFKAEAVDLFQRMVRHKKSKKNPRAIFSPSLKKFVLTLNFYSPTGYKYVRKVFKYGLPHPRKLGKWHEKTDAAPGFTAEAFEVLKRKYSATKTKIYCTLVVDEMAIRQQSTWNGRRTEGLVDHGTGSIENDSVASHAFVMMLVSTNENWKLPVAYFFVNGLTADCKANLIRTCLEKCHEIGVCVVALTFDGSRSNFNTANVLGCSLDNVNNLKTTFKHPSCDMDVAVFPDPCHMIKLVRNTFESKKIFFTEDGQYVKWQFLVNLLNLQKSETLTFGNKITSRHIKFRNNIMTVKLATQLFSLSVAKSLQMSEEILQSTRFINTSATVKFIENFNHIFDVMNSRKRNNFGYQKPVCPENRNRIFYFLDEMKKYICSLQYFVKFRHITKNKINLIITKERVVDTISKTGFIGFIICIESLKHLYTTLVETNILQYISTHRLSQDHIELFFGIIRRQRGYNNNPNAKQFRGIYKKVLGHLELRSSLSGNCIPLDNFPMLTCASAVDIINQTLNRKVDENNKILGTNEGDSFKKHKVTQFTLRVRFQNVEKNKALLSDSFAEMNVGILSDLLSYKIKHNLSTSSDQIVGYIAGWVSQELVKTLKCEVCVAELVTVKKMNFHKLISFKDMGGLCYPSEDVFLICAKSEKILKYHISQGKHITSEVESLRVKLTIAKSFLDLDILSKLSIHSQDQPATFNHRIHLLRAIIDKYCNVRLHYVHKANPVISAVTKRQKINKLSLFEGK